uniref:U1764aa n=1 Tax=Mycobacterium leprae TaxID=1769 RepID=Q50011_MYCLR|nr:u1764aa [Mycobacterium leprae]
MVVKYDGYHHRTNSPVSTSAIRTSGASSKNSAVIIIRMIIEGKPEDVAQHIHASELPLHLNGCTHHASNHRYGLNLTTQTLNSNG